MKGRQALLLGMELALYTAFTSLQDAGSKIKVRWFLITARKLFEKYYPQQVEITSEGKKAVSYTFYLLNHANSRGVR